MECGNYRGIKFLGCAMKMNEKVIERWILEKVQHKTRLGFKDGKGTINAIFILK